MMKSTDLGYEIQEDLTFTPAVSWLAQPAHLERFQQTGVRTLVELADTRTAKVIATEGELEEWRSANPEAGFVWNICLEYSGTLLDGEDDDVCPHCGGPMVSKGYEEITLKHTAEGMRKAVICVKRHRFVCTCCHRQSSASIPFQTEGHRITLPLESHIRWLCWQGFTHTEIQRMTGVDRHIIKSIDKCRLEEKFMDGGVLRKPEYQTKYLGIDEFSLHKGHSYAVQFMDLERGHVLFVIKGKTKDVVHKFIEHVGLTWMAGVEAVFCDMNADFPRAFLEKCPHLEIVYDRFHLVKNFNTMVLTEVRKDVQRELQKNNDPEAAKALKGSKYIILSNRSTLQELDRKAKERRSNNTKAGEDVPEVEKKKSLEERYDEIIALNELFFMGDYLKNMLTVAYQQTDRDVMEADIREIIAVCHATENKHFLRFAGLLERHLSGITSHAVYPGTSGKVEGMNNKIKTIRRRSYGLSDTAFFFLKIMDASRRRSA